MILVPQEEAPAQSLELKIDSVELQRAIIERHKSRQNLVQGVLAGGVAALLGASLWAAITVATGYQIGWMAVGVGCLVGLAVRSHGKGIHQIFGVIGSLWALFGCALGNLLAVCGILSVEENIPFLEILSVLDLDIIAELMVVTFSPIDFLFYSIALFEAYKLSFRQFLQEELSEQLPG